MTETVLASLGNDGCVYVRLWKGVCVHLTCESYCISANYMENIGIIKADGSLTHTIPSSSQQQSLPAFQQPLPPKPPFMTNF